MKLEYNLYSILLSVFLCSCCNMKTILDKETENQLHTLYEQQLKHNDILKSKKINEEIDINDGTFTDYWLLKLLGNNRSYALRNNNPIVNIEDGVFYSLDFYSATDSFSVIWNENFAIYFRNDNKLNTVKSLSENDRVVKETLEPVKYKITQNNRLPNISKSDYIVTGGGIYVASIIEISNKKVSNVKTKFWNKGKISW